MTLSVGTGDLHEAINKLWDVSGLDTEFKEYWTDDARDTNEFLSLNKDEAAPDNPWPYCVYEVTKNTVAVRMTASVTEGRREIHHRPVIFKIHTKVLDGVPADEIANILLDNILQVYGGHPTVVPRALELNYGNFLIAQYQNDFGMITGDEEYVHFLEYIMMLDVPVAA